MSGGTKRLKNLRVTRVDLVDAGANFDRTTGEGAHIRLFKRADQGAPVTEPTKPAPVDDSAVLKIVKAVGRALGWSDDQVQKAEDGLTFDDALFRRKAQRVLAGVSDIFGAWYESVEQILYGPAEEKATKVKEATASLMAAIKSELPGIVDDAVAKGEAEPVEKVGAKIAGTRLARLKTMHKELGKLIREAEPPAKGDGPVQKTTITAGEGTKVDDVLKALPDEQRTALQAHISDLEARLAKATPTDTGEDALADLTKGLPDTVRKAIEAQTAALVARVEKAEQTANAEKEARELAEFKVELRALKLPGVDVDKDAPVLKTLRDANADAWKRQLEILKSAGAAIAKGGLLGELGANGESADADTAEAEIEKRAGELRKADPKLTEAQAIVKVLEDDAELYARHRAEQDGD